MVGNKIFNDFSSDSSDITTIEAVSISELDYQNEEKLEINFDLGMNDLYLKNGISEQLYKVEYSQAEGVTNRVVYAHHDLQIYSNFRQPAKYDFFSLKKIFTQGLRTCNAYLHPGIEIDLKIKLKGCKANIDFSNLRLKKLRMSLGATDGKIFFGNPKQNSLDFLKLEAEASNISLEGLGNANCSEIDINLGTGNYLLDFSGSSEKDIFSEISLRFGRLKILVPEDIGIKIKTNEKLTDFNFPNFVIENGYRISKDFEKKEKKITLRIDAFLARLDFGWLKI